MRSENLRALRALQGALSEGVDLIYIDPPYNTGKDFSTYSDSFAISASRYRALSGDHGRENMSGRHHAGWLSMMAPRLVLARALMCEHGVIAVSIDDHEAHHLRMLMDEIFGPDQFAAQITWQRKRESANDGSGFCNKGEYILVYTRSERARFLNAPLSNRYLQKSYREPTDQFPRGRWRAVPITASKGHQGGGYTYSVTTPSGREITRTWLCPRSTYDAYLAENRLYFGVRGSAIPGRVIYAHESSGTPPSNIWIWEDIATNKQGKKAIVELFDGHHVFPTPKPTQLLTHLMRICIAPGARATVLDFFAGSGTTGEAAMRYAAQTGAEVRSVQVQQPTPLPEASPARALGMETIVDVAIARHERAATALGIERPLCVWDVDDQG